MLDIKFIRENIELVRKAIKEKNENVDIDKFVSLDNERRKLIQERDSIRQEKKRISHQVAELKTAPINGAATNVSASRIPELVIESKKVSEKEKDIETRLSQIESDLHNELIWIPNLVHPSVPRDKSIIVRECVGHRNFDFAPLTADELCSALGIVDFKWGARVAGSNFPCYKGLGARLERALINFMLDLHLDQGYTEIFTPFVVNRVSMFGTAQLPKLEEDMYLIEKDDLFLNPTTEVALINMHSGDILREEDLPINYIGYSASFRREAGSYGRETKGLKRVHQFNEIELIKFTNPSESYEELEKMVQDAEEVLKLLGLSYRVVLLCAAELSFASAKTYDIEVWAPVSKEWLEVSSCSNCEDFQARRAKIKFRSKQGTQFVHILNGTGVATPRTFIALLEQYQQKDRTIEIPSPLIHYLGPKL